MAPVGIELMARRIWGGMTLIAVSGILAVSSSALAQVPFRPETDLERIEFALEDVYYRILVPRGSRLSPISEPGCIRIWHPLATRSMTFLELCSSSSAETITFGSRAVLTNGASIRYSVDHDIGGGSGGTEGELKGQLDLNAVFGLGAAIRGNGATGRAGVWITWVTWR